MKNIDLYEALVLPKTAEEMKRLIRDLCTPAEIRAFEERWEIVQLLDEGEMSYRQISEVTGASTTTVGRVARFLNDESYNGYRVILDRLSEKKGNKS